VQVGLVEVNVYVEDPGELRLMKFGDHVPEILFEDVKGRFGAIPFWQIGSI
jgi:hypothetical protein